MTASAQRTRPVAPPSAATRTFALRPLAFSLLACTAIAAQAQVEAFRESFDTGLGQFTATGSAGASDGAAFVRGCFWCTDGAVVSRAISTVGLNNLKLSYDRTVRNLDNGERAIAAYSVNDGAWTQLESVRNASGRVSFDLPAAAANQAAVRLRFRVTASRSDESLVIDNVLLQGTAVENGSANPGGEPPAASPYAKGPDPTAADLEANAGPFSYATEVVAAPSANGYGGGTIYYPDKVQGPLGAIVVIPGYQARQSSVAWWGPRLASHGFVVMVIDTRNLGDLPASRATQLMAAADQLKAFNVTPGHAVEGRIDPARIGIMGWSYGGGGTLLAAKDHPEFKAAIPMAPKTVLGTTFPTLSVPTLVIGCQSDGTAPVKNWAIPFYESIPRTTPKAYLESAGGSHGCVTNRNAVLGKYGVSWMKRFLDEDTRYSPFLCGDPHRTDVQGTAVISGYRENCPY